MIDNRTVSIIEPIGSHGGMNYYDLGLAFGLNSNDTKVRLYSSEETDIPKNIPFFIKKPFKGVWGSKPKVIRAINFFLGLVHSLVDSKKNNVSIIHYHYFHYTYLELISVFLARLFLFKIVITVHDVESFSGKDSKRVAQHIFSLASKIIVHNSVSQKEIESHFANTKSMTSIVPHGNYLDTISIFKNAEMPRESLGVPKSSKVLLFFVQIKKVKGLDILLKAIPSVLEEHPDLKLIIAGKVWKDTFEIYQDLIEKNNTGENVISHIHYIKDEDVSKYYAAADLVVLPYRKIYQSGVLLMAMSYKVAVLTSDIPGMTEIIQDGMNGYLFESENISDLSTKIPSIFSNSDEITTVAQAGL
jgi:D-inositol-3-phosphate glycosyltransferase